MRHAHAGRIRHRIGDRRQGRDDRGFADTAHAIGVVGVGNLEDHRVDEGQVGADRDAIIEEARILQTAILAVNILLVERPADALRGTALILALDIGRICLLYTSPSPRDRTRSRMPSSA